MSNNNNDDDSHRLKELASQLKKVVWVNEGQTYLEGSWKNAKIVVEVIKELESLSQQQSPLLKELRKKVDEEIAEEKVLLQSHKSKPMKDWALGFTEGKLSGYYLIKSKFEEIDAAEKKMKEEAQK